MHRIIDIDFSADPVASSASSQPECYKLTASKPGRRHSKGSSFAARFGMGTLYDSYAQRTEAFRRDPPPPDWNGVYEAESE